MEIKMPGGQKIKCDNYLPKSFRACGTCKHWTGCRYMNAMGSTVLGFGFMDKMRMGACNKTREPMANGFSCKNWEGFK